MARHIAYISIGSNIGDKLAHCQNGINALVHPEISILKGQSRFYRTEPVDYEDQDWFVNGVVKVETLLDPYELFERLKQIERDAGRTNHSIRFGPRVLDLDILIYDDLTLDTVHLIIPHPRMHKRRFVLLPFCDIDPLIEHPVLKEQMKSLLENLGDSDQVVLEY
jgi:2-amino-4-hydroxy-6-hydroxymethyldihydropteridine diphosphokinase